jgi:hypothetical protein
LTIDNTSFAKSRIEIFRFVKLDHAKTQRAVRLEIALRVGVVRCVLDALRPPAGPVVAPVPFPNVTLRPNAVPNHMTV